MLNRKACEIYVGVVVCSHEIFHDIEILKFIEFKVSVHTSVQYQDIQSPEFLQAEINKGSASAVCVLTALRFRNVCRKGVHLRAMLLAFLFGLLQPLSIPPREHQPRLTFGIDQCKLLAKPTAGSSDEYDAILYCWRLTYFDNGCDA